MAQRLGGRLHVVYLASLALMAQIMSGPDCLPPEAYAKQPFRIAFFSDEGEAAGWLQQRQQLLVG